MIGSVGVSGKSGDPCESPLKRRLSRDHSREFPHFGMVQMQSKTVT